MSLIVPTSSFETSVIFAAVIGALFLGEKMTRRRLAATGAVLAGLVVLKL